MSGDENTRMAELLRRMREYREQIREMLLKDDKSKSRFTAISTDVLNNVLSGFIALAEGEVEDLVRRRKAEVQAYKAAKKRSTPVIEYTMTAIEAGVSHGRASLVLEAKDLKNRRAGGCRLEFIPDEDAFALGCFLGQPMRVVLFSVPPCEVCGNSEFSQGGRCQTCHTRASDHLAEEERRKREAEDAQ